MIEINPRYEHLKEYIERLPLVFEDEGREIYRLRNLIKVFEAPDGTLLNVKRYHVPRGLNLLAYSLGLRKTKGRRAWEYPNKLLINGIATPNPVAYIEEHHKGMLGYSYFVSLQCPYEHTLYEMATAAPALYMPMANAVAELAAKMHAANILHLDFTPGNILWCQTADEGFKFCIVDINRMRFGQVDFKDGLKNLIKFWGPKDFLAQIFRKYALLRDENPLFAQQLGMEWRREFWKHYLKRHQVPFVVEF